MTISIYVAVFIAICLITFLLVATASLIYIARCIGDETTAIKKLAATVSRIADTIDAIQNKYSDKS